MLQYILFPSILFTLMIPDGATDRYNCTSLCDSSINA